MSKRGSARRKRFRLEPLPRSIRRFVDELVTLGCDRQRLLWRIESFLEKYETTEKQQLDDIFDRRGADKAVEIAIDKIREAATKIRLLQTAYPLLPIALKAFLKDMTPAQRRALAVYEELPLVLEQFASAAQYELDLIGPLLSRDRSEEHTSELQSHSFISYAVF